MTGNVNRTGQVTGQATPVSLTCALGDASAHVPDQTRPDQFLRSKPQQTLGLDHRTDASQRATGLWTTR